MADSECRKSVKESPAAMVEWINANLGSNLRHWRELRSCAHWCQIMHMIDPAVLDLRDVRFAVSGRKDCIHNYGQLRQAFDAAGQILQFSAAQLLRPDEEKVLQLGKWMYAYYQLKYDGHPYDAVIERQGQEFRMLSEPSTSGKRIGAEPIPNSTTNSQRTSFTSLVKRYMSYAKRKSSSGTASKQAISASDVDIVKGKSLVQVYGKSDGSSAEAKTSTPTSKQSLFTRIFRKATDISAQRDSSRSNTTSNPPSQEPSTLDPQSHTSSSGTIELTAVYSSDKLTRPSSATLMPCPNSSLNTSRPAPAELETCRGEDINTESTSVFQHLTSKLEDSAGPHLSSSLSSFTSWNSKSTPVHKKSEMMPHLANSCCSRCFPRDSCSAASSKSFSSPGWEYRDRVRERLRVKQSIEHVQSWLQDMNQNTAYAKGDDDDEESSSNDESDQFFKNLIQHYGEARALMINYIRRERDRRSEERKREQEAECRAQARCPYDEIVGLRIAGKTATNTNQQPKIAPQAPVKLKKIETFPPINHTQRANEYVRK
ncbi:microtubule-associated protein RP/EB family member 1-like [Scaptodrosophila lebanonensis]|uniref:Microtubule-associated protein RP/EB family member 1-like n=1 Tax=Drosophila lebanonensis TaxID=7225 RepID=A0A6J2TUJ4_DROLE|nr:microtubule-associated protein RP/EB family member 1-like [Scaptodrosophila lebanonensis]XP_030378809.1 microtubule-associated protein RP/EB family member 1-like [Scaptodrosophila lebanonensis]